MSKKKKIVIISTIVIACFIVIGIVYAFFSDSITKHNKFKLGSVDIEDINLAIKEEYSSQTAHAILEPGDIDTVSWTTRNKGASAVKTRQTLEIYWEDVDLDTTKQVLFLYPANMKKSEILADFEKGAQAQYKIATEAITREVEGKTQRGIKYEFLGDTLNGTDGNDVASEANYNSEVEGKIDTAINTDDSNKKEDEVAFRVLVNPNLSYLYQKKPIFVKITTEGMQYLDGMQFKDGEWVVVDTQEIP